MQYTTYTTIPGGLCLPQAPAHAHCAILHSCPALIIHQGFTTGVSHSPGLWFGLLHWAIWRGEKHIATGQEAPDVVPALPLMSWAPMGLHFSIYTVHSFHPRDPRFREQHEELKRQSHRPYTSSPTAAPRGNVSGHSWALMGSTHSQSETSKPFLIHQF